ncbi:MAG: Holliday junction resolvase RuvX [Balneolaceae bacterium]|nr:MAG: Holliday junction resolvase RuvX [Balneolaceae bacterium]
MAKLGRIIGVDVGRKKVGLARTDLLRTSANPIGTFTPVDSHKEIERQITEEGPVIAVVVGWPLTPQDEHTHATELAGDYIRFIEGKFKDIPVYKMDERYTSRHAMQIMVESGVSKSKRHEKGRLDQAAAALILQQFLEAHPEI